MIDPLDNIFGTQEDEQKKKAKNPATSQSRTVSADPLENSFANAPKPTAKQVQVQQPTQEKTDAGFFDKAVSFVGKVATNVGDWFNKQQQKNAEAEFEMGQIMKGKTTITKDPVTGKNVMSSPQLDAYKAAKTQEEKAKIIKDFEQEAPLIKFLNSNTGKKITGAVAEATSNIPLKTWARLKAIGDDTYDEAYASLLKERKEKIADPNTSYFTKLRYQVEDSGVQSALGILLGLGVSAATRGKVKPQVVTTPYFAAISAEGQRQEKGQVESLGNIAIDTVGDTVLSGIADATLKTFLKEGSEATLKALMKKTVAGFGVEGSTEVSQSLLKYANDYKNAKTDEEKKKVADALGKYVKEGGIVNEFLVGGISGAAITGTAGAVGMAVNPSLQPQAKVEGDAGGESSTLVGEFNKDFSAVREEAKTLESAVRENPNDKVSLAKLTELQDQLNDYQQAVKERPVYVSDQSQENPLATIETVKYPDGTFSYSFSADTQGSSIQAPFSVSGTFKSQEEAIKVAKREILDWVKTKIPNAEGAELAKLQEIQSEIKASGKAPKNQNISESTEKTEVSATNQQKTVETATKQAEKTQVSPNVEKTRAGVYRVTQYTQKGEAQGKAEARFTKSKKTGKMFFEVTKDGERIVRMPLEKAKKTYQTTDRPTMVERAVNGVKDKETGKYQLRQSNAPVIKNTSQNSVEKKPVKTKGEVKNSRAFKRIQERLGEYADIDVNYNRLNLAKDTANALEFIEKNPKEAKKIALGLMGAPEGVTETAISIALAEQASQNKDYALQAQLERSRSLRQTRRGQEIVAERGRFNENSPHFFMQQVLAARIENAGKQKFRFFSKKKSETVANSAEAKMKEGSEAIKQTIKKKLTAADLAQNVIDSLTC